MGEIENVRALSRLVDEAFDRKALFGRDAVRASIEGYLKAIADKRGLYEKDIDVKVTGNAESGCLCVDLTGLTPEGNAMLVRAIADGGMSTSCCKDS